jgi:hypothetical protein
MQLRDHPLMTRKRVFPTWPPKWMADRDRDDKPVGEVGILEDVLMSNLVDNKVFIFMQCEGLRYMGFMSFDDPPFCRQIYTLLQSNVGLSINELGDLDVSFTL